MFRVDKPSAVAVLPAPQAASAPGYFSDGNPSVGQQATIVPADWLNAVQEEILYPIEQMGMAADKTNRQQLKKAIDYLIQNQASNYGSGSGINTYVVTLTPAPSGYGSGGMSLKIKFANTNTGSATLNINALGAKTIKLVDGSILTAGDISAGMIANLVYDGADFILLNPASPLIDSMALVKGSADATKKLRFEIDGIATATTRVWTAPDRDINFKTCPFAAETTSSQSIPASTNTVIQAATKTLDADNTYDTANYRHIPSVAGKYMYFLNAFINQVNGKNLQTFFRKNGSSSINYGLFVSYNMTGGSIQVYTNSLAVIDMNGSTDYVEAYALQNDIGSQNLTARMFGLRIQ